MKQTRYVLGRAFEYRVLRDLRERGCFAMRSAGSHGPVDIIALHEGNVWLVQCKRNGKISNAEESELLALAAEHSALPLLADMPAKHGIAYWRLRKGQMPQLWERKK